jgi:hypothetical protein
MPWSDIDSTLDSLRGKGFEVVKGADAHVVPGSGVSDGRILVVVDHLPMSFDEARELDAGRISLEDIRARRA